MKKLVALVLVVVAAAGVYYYLVRDRSAVYSLDESSAKALIEGAGAMSQEDWKALASSASSPSLQSLEDHPLSLVLLSMAPLGDEATRAEFNFAGGMPPKPQVMAEVMERSSAGPGRTSLLQRDHITTIELDIKGDEASGSATFLIPKVAGGRFEFSARRDSGLWRIREFRFPLRDVKTVLGEDGIWKASGRLAGEGG